MSYSEILVSLENIIIDKFATVPTTRNSKIVTGARMEIGMAAKDDVESVREGDQRIVDLVLQAVYKGKWSFWKGSELDRKIKARWQRWQK